MMTERWRNGQQVQPRYPDNLAEAGWRDIIVEVPEGDLPPLGSTGSLIVLKNVFALR